MIYVPDLIIYVCPCVIIGSTRTTRWQDWLGKYM